MKKLNSKPNYVCIDASQRFFAWVHDRINGEFVPVRVATHSEMAEARGY